MKLSELKKNLSELINPSFYLSNGEPIPAHYHLTEIAKQTKHFMDCGGKERLEEKITIQLWTAEDYEHRLDASKFIGIIDLATRKLSLEDLEVEVEYQGNTISRYALEFRDQKFHLLPTHTDCLAKDSCGIPIYKEKKDLATLSSQTDCCSPESNCC